MTAVMSEAELHFAAWLEAQELGQAPSWPAFLATHAACRAELETLEAAWRDVRRLLDGLVEAEFGDGTSAHGLGRFVSESLVASPWPLAPGAQVLNARLRIYFQEGLDHSVAWRLIVDLVDMGSSLDVSDGLAPAVVEDIASFVVTGRGYRSTDVTSGVQEALSRGLAPQFRLRVENEESGSGDRFTWNQFVESGTGTRPSLTLVATPPVDVAEFTPDTPGEYAIQLVVNDGIDDSEPDTALLTVNRNDRHSCLGSNDSFHPQP